jgi:hypothetical protein
MEPAVKKELEAILKQEAERRSAVQQSQTARNQASCEASKKWSQLTEEVLKPSLKEMLDMFNTGGWDARVVDSPNGFGVTLQKGRQRVFQSSKDPFVRFELLKDSSTVLVRSGTPSQTGEGTPDATCDVDKITPDFVHKHIIRVVRDLTK